MSARDVAAREAALAELRADVNALRLSLAAVAGWLYQCGVFGEQDIDALDELMPRDRPTHADTKESRP